MSKHDRKIARVTVEVYCNAEDAYGVSAELTNAYYGSEHAQWRSGEPTISLPYEKDVPQAALSTLSTLVRRARGGK